MIHLGIQSYQMGTGAGVQGMIGVVNVNTTAVGNVGTGEDNLMTYALAANSMSAAGKGLRITVWGTAANNANAKTLKLYFGTQIILTNSITTAQAGVWEIEAIVLSTGTDAQDWKSAFTNTGTVSTLDNEVGTATQDDGAAITIKCTGEATDNNDIVQEGMIVEFIN